MNRLGVTVVVVALLSACAGGSEARRDVRNILPGVHNNAMGIVQSVDGNIITVTGIENEPRPVLFEGTSDVKVTRGESQISLSDVQDGDAVRIAYEASVGPEKLYKVEVLTGVEAENLKKGRGVGGSGQ